MTKVQDRANVAIACPTGLLAASYRQSFARVHIDTVHSFFALHVEEHLTLDLLADYDLVVVEEIGQLTRAQFERIMRLWVAADQQPCLVFLGDFKQFRSIDNTSARDSPLWKQIRLREVYEVQRSTCPELSRKLSLVRDSQPTEARARAVARDRHRPGRQLRQQAPRRVPEVRLLLHRIACRHETYADSQHRQGA